MRLRDTEIDRLKQKLSDLALSERATVVKHKLALAAWRSGAVLNTSNSFGGGGGSYSPSNRSVGCSSVNSAVSSPSYRGPGGASTSVSPRGGSSSSRLSGGGGLCMSRSPRRQRAAEEASAWDVIEALDAERAALESRNEELSEQLKSMSVSSPRSEGSSMWRNDESPGDISVHFSDLDAEDNCMTDRSGADSYMIVGSNGSRAGSPEKTDRGNIRRPPPIPILTPTAAKMYDMITEQQRTIESAEARCEMLRAKVDESDKLQSQLRGKVQEMKEVRHLSSLSNLLSD